MSNIFDQYQLDSRSRLNQPTTPSTPLETEPEPWTVGADMLLGLSRSTADGQPPSDPMFVRKRDDFHSTAGITHMQVENGLAVIVLRSLRVVVNDTSAKTKYELDLNQVLPPPQQQQQQQQLVSRLFLESPNANHCLICFRSGLTVYFGRANRRLRCLTKLKDGQGNLLMVESIAWNEWRSSPTSSGPILIGTRTGSIYELELHCSEATFSRSNPEQNLHQVYSLADADNKNRAGVNGLQIFHRPPSFYAIVATTANRLYQAVGQISGVQQTDGFFGPLFSLARGDKKRFIEVPSSVGRSQLAVFHARRGDPLHIAWLVVRLLDNNVFFGRLSWDLVVMTSKTQWFVANQESSQPGQTVVYDETFLVDQRLIPVGADTAGSMQPVSPSQPPISLAVSEFHAIVLFPKRLEVVSLVTDDLIDKDLFVGDGLMSSMLGLCWDRAKTSLWAYSANVIYKYDIVDETRHLSRIFSARLNFEEARKYCQGSLAKLHQVNLAEAEHLFSKGRWVESGRLYALADCSFEWVAVRFFERKLFHSLRVFLKTKFDTLSLKKDQGAALLIIVWFVDLCLAHMRSADPVMTPAVQTTTANPFSTFQLKHSPMGKSTGMESKLAANSDLVLSAGQQVADVVRSELYSFLEDQRVLKIASVSSGVMYELFSAHDANETMLFFARLCGQHEAVIGILIGRNQFDDALSALRSQLQDVELYYRYSPVFFEKLPADTVSLWIEMGDRLKLSRLAPALIQSDCLKSDEQAVQAIRFLEHCVAHLKAGAGYKSLTTQTDLLNLMIALYARHKPNALAAFLRENSPPTLQFDVEFVLRLCAQLQLTRPLIEVYRLMGLLEQAVELALTVDVGLAKELCNDVPSWNNELKRKLWLLVARHVVKDGSDVRGAVEFLSQCNSLLRIEDLLPHFPDFVRIDQFKETICDSLENYNQQMESLRVEMETTKEAADQIRKKLAMFRQDYNKFDPGNELCDSCQMTLVSPGLIWSRQLTGFYLFPCGHKLHTPCLVRELLMSLSSFDRLKLEQLLDKVSSGQPIMGRLTSVESSIDVADGAGSPLNDRTDESDRRQLESLLSTDCVFCGDLVVGNVDRSLDDRNHPLAHGWD